MEKQYKEIEFGFGSIESAVAQLEKHKANGELVVGDFNGKKLYSDVDDLDSAFVKITGRTKAEFDEFERKTHEEYEAKKAAHKAAIPELTKEWVAKGRVILDAKYHELWEKCVPIRLGDLYEGMELGNCLDIVKVLNEGGDMEAAKNLIVGQGHSGMSFGLVRSMVHSFCDRGNEFVAYLSKP